VKIRVKILVILVVDEDVVQVKIDGQNGRSLNKMKVTSVSLMVLHLHGIQQLSIG
jgi:hypothetical protein